MPRIETFTLIIKTGSLGTEEPPRFCFNGFDCEFDEPTGGTGAGQRFEGRFAPRSVPHQLYLAGPADGIWEIAGIEIHYELSDGDQYDIRLGAVTLDGTNAVNLWRKRPQLSFDV